MGDCQVRSTKTGALNAQNHQILLTFGIFVACFIAIIDPNTDITLWESGAIVSYLVATYDKSDKLTYASSPEKFQLQQWSYFQASGQGPYFGQAAWYVLFKPSTSVRVRCFSIQHRSFQMNRFYIFHPEPLPSARERYTNEINRVASVLDAHLTGRSWLVGDKCTYADLAFVMWNAQISFILKDAKEPWDAAKYPNFARWQESMLARDSVKHVLSVLGEQEVKSGGRL